MADNKYDSPFKDAVQKKASYEERPTLGNDPAGKVQGDMEGVVAPKDLPDTTLFHK